MNQVLQAISPVALRAEEEYEESKSDELMCAVCLAARKTHVLIPCGHLCVCLEYSQRIGNVCPLDRQPFESARQVFN